ncbi:protein takeout-like [Teleopsis dalmanni]|uniref:protein takeout-like n=1 Tax=Teleopsis dalmanni TaxID=139649 RepID=UPI0018CF9BC5|nr:protein takeout-like [Teleopsis dalmanni]
MYEKLLCLSFLLCAFSVINAKFPVDPKPCKYGDTECILKISNYFVKEKFQGDDAINLITIDPLKVAKINIKQGAESPVNIDLQFVNNNIEGLKSVKVAKIKGFGNDLTQKHAIHFMMPHVSLVGDYSINGKILILPISGNGKSNMTFVNTEMIVQFSGEPIQKDDGIHMKLKDIKIKFIPERLHYYFGNLFNGDKALGDNMNAFLNENWKEIFGEVQSSLESAFKQVVEAVLNTVFSKYPYEKYFVH